MTERLYQTDSYLREFAATITATTPDTGALVLDRTAFYPGGGGQPCDFGALSDMPITAVKVMSGQILHIVQGSLPAGTQVRGVLDWERRYKLMRTHTAMHVLCGVVFRDYGAQVTGGDMEPLKGRMDFEFENLTKELVGVIEEAVNREVEAARDVRVRILPRAEAFAIPDLIRTKINLLPPEIQEIRTVELVGLDLQIGRAHV